MAFFDNLGSLVGQSFWDARNQLPGVTPQPGIFAGFKGDNGQLSHIGGLSQSAIGLARSTPNSRFLDPGTAWTNRQPGTPQMPGARATVPENYPDFLRGMFGGIAPQQMNGLDPRQVQQLPSGQATPQGPGLSGLQIGMSDPNILWQLSQMGALG